jgi:hypothetical protein
MKLPKRPAAWETFLKIHQACGAHFHGEGDPPDLILEVKPSPDSQGWLVVARPQGHPDTDDARNEMCEEMSKLLPECPFKEFWYLEGWHPQRAIFVFKHPYNYGYEDVNQPKAWFLTGWTSDDHGYTLEIDLWETPEEPTRLAKLLTETQISNLEKEISNLRAHLHSLETFND